MLLLRKRYCWTKSILYNFRLGTEDRAECDRRLPLILGHDGEDQHGGGTEGKGEADNGGGALTVAAEEERG